MFISFEQNILLFVLHILLVLLLFFVCTCVCVFVSFLTVYCLLYSSCPGFLVLVLVCLVIHYNIADLSCVL